MVKSLYANLSSESKSFILSLVFHSGCRVANNPCEKVAKCDNHRGKFGCRCPKGDTWEYCELVKNFIILHYPYGPTLTFNEKKERKENPCMKDVNDDASSGLQ